MVATFKPKIARIRRKLDDEPLVKKKKGIMTPVICTFALGSLSFPINLRRGAHLDGCNFQAYDNDRRIGRKLNLCKKIK